MRVIYLNLDADLDKNETQPPFDKLNLELEWFECVELVRLIDSEWEHTSPTVISKLRCLLSDTLDSSKEALTTIKNGTC